MRSVTFGEASEALDEMRNEGIESSTEKEIIDYVLNKKYKL